MLMNRSVGLHHDFDASLLLVAKCLVEIKAFSSSVAPLARRAAMSFTAPAHFTVTAAVTFALFTQLILIETSRPQFAAHVSCHWSLASLPIGSAISLATLAQPVFVFASQTQLFALSAASSGSPIVNSNAARSNLHGLREACDRKNEKSSRSC